MEILLLKKTTDADLEIGMEVAYKDKNGDFTKTGKITNWIVLDGIMNFSLDNSLGYYHAIELKLIKKT